jgi:Ca-activated chloride channel family protein
MEITFLNIEYLWLLLGLPLLVILHFYSLRYIHNRAIKFANFEALERVTGGIVLSRNFPLLFLRLTGLLFLTLSLAGATLWYKGHSDVADYVLAIDSSGSMLADDFKPNRLEAAKEAAISFVENLESDSSIGIVSFSGSALLELSPTNKKDKVKDSIDNIQISALHGTAIGDALKTAANTLVNSDKSRIMILLTDGQENVASAEELTKIIDFVKSKQITVNSIGVATASGGSLPGTAALSTIDEKTLRLIANSTGGSYIHSENKDEIIGAYKSFSYKSIESKIPIYLRLPFIILTLVILFVEWVLINTKFRTIP